MRAPRVIFYHQVLRQPRPEHFVFRSVPTVDQFRADMLFIREHFHPISMQQMCREWYGRRRWPARAVLITFDDGFKNNLLAARVLHELGMSATFFVLSDVLDTDFKPTYVRFEHILAMRTRQLIDSPLGRVDLSKYMTFRRWFLLTKEELLNQPQEQRHAALDRLAEQLGSPPMHSDPDYQYLSSADLRELLQLGQEIGGHSATHEKLSRCDERELQYQLVESRQRLQAASGAPIETMSYPDGRLSPLVVEIASKHFRMAFSACDSFPSTDPYRYPRRCVGLTARAALSPWFLSKQRTLRLVKRLLGDPLPRWEEPRITADQRA